MKGEDNRQRIIETALRLFSENGYAETSIADIAAQAGMLKGNVSYYFKTKAELLQWITQAREEQLFRRLHDGLSPDATAHECLEQFLRVTEASAEEFARVGCPVGTLCSELGKEDPALQPYASRILKALQSWLEHQFGRLLPAEAASEHAEHLLALLQGAAIMAHAYHDPDLVVRRVHTARIWLRSILIHEEIR